MTTSWLHGPLRIRTIEKVFFKISQLFYALGGAVFCFPVLREFVQITKTLITKISVSCLTFTWRYLRVWKFPIEVLYQAEETYTEENKEFNELFF